MFLWFCLVASKLDIGTPLVDQREGFEKLPRHRMFWLDNATNFKKVNISIKNSLSYSKGQFCV